MFDIREYDYYMMFKPFKYWGDYTDDEHDLWLDGLSNTQSINENKKQDLQILTPRMTSLLENVYFKKEECKTLMDRMPEHLINKPFYRPRRTSSAGSR